MAEIHQQMKQKVQNKIEVYNIILDRCYKKIRDSIKKNYTYCIFQVPEFIYGRPLYDIVHCTQYIHRKLLECAYKINFVNATTMIIQWTVPKINWEEIDPPIQLCLPSPPQTSSISYHNDNLEIGNLDLESSDYDMRPITNKIMSQQPQQMPQQPPPPQRYPSLENLPPIQLKSTPLQQLMPRQAPPTFKSAFHMEIVPNANKMSPNPSMIQIPAAQSQLHSQQQMSPPVKNPKNYQVKRVIDFY